MENTIYLEDILKNIESRQNVLIYLSSAHALYTSETEEPRFITDSIGNHYTENWNTAIERNNLEETFVVKSVVTLTPDQMAIYIDNVRGDKDAARLEIESNQAAINAAFTD